MLSGEFYSEALEKNDAAVQPENRTESEKTKKTVKKVAAKEKKAPKAKKKADNTKE